MKQPTYSELEDLSPKRRDPSPVPEIEDLSPKLNKNVAFEKVKKVVKKRLDKQISAPKVEEIKPQIEVIPDPKIEERKDEQLKILRKIKTSMRKFKPKPKLVEDQTPKPPAELSPTSKLA